MKTIAPPLHLIEEGAVVKKDYYHYSLDLYIDPYQYESATENNSFLRQLINRHNIKSELNTEKGCIELTIYTELLVNFLEDLLDNNLISLQEYQRLVELENTLSQLEIFISTPVPATQHRTIYFLGAEFSLYDFLKRHIRGYLETGVMRHKIEQPEWCEYSLYLNPEELNTLLECLKADRQPVFFR